MFSLGFHSLDDTPSSSTGEPPPHIKREQSRQDDVVSPDSYLDPIPNRDTINDNDSEPSAMNSPPISLTTPRDHHCAQERKRRDRVNRHFQELDALCLGVDNALMNKRRDRDAILVNAIYVIKKLKAQVANPSLNGQTVPFPRDSSANSADARLFSTQSSAPRVPHQTPPPVQVKRASPHSGTESESISPSTNSTITPLPPQAQASNGVPTPNFLNLRAPAAACPLPMNSALATALQSGSGVPMNEVLLALRESPSFFPTPSPAPDVVRALSTPASLRVASMDESEEPTCFVSNAPPPAFGSIPLPTSPQLNGRSVSAAQFAAQANGRATSTSQQSLSAAPATPGPASSPSASPSIPAALAALAQLPPHVISALPPQVQAQYVQLIQEYQQQQRQHHQQQLLQQQQQVQQQLPQTSQHLLKQLQQQQQQNQQLQLLRQLQQQQQQQQLEQQKLEREREQRQQQHQQAQQLLLQQIQSRHLPRPSYSPIIPANPRHPTTSLSNAELLKRLEAAFALSPTLPTSFDAGSNDLRSPQMNGPSPMNATNSPLTPLVEAHNGALKRKALSPVEDISYQITPHGSHRCILRQLPICVVDAVGVIVGANSAALDFLFADPHTPILNDPNNNPIDPAKLGSNGFDVAPAVDQLPLSRCLLYFAHPDEAMKLCGILFGMIAGQRMPTYLQLRLRCAASSVAAADESTRSPNDGRSAQYVTVHMILSPRKDDSERLESVDCAFVPV